MHGTFAGYSSPGLRRVGVGPAKDTPHARGLRGLPTTKDQGKASFTRLSCRVNDFSALETGLNAQLVLATAQNAPINPSHSPRQFPKPSSAV